jgi:hypothetical protein
VEFLFAITLISLNVALLMVFPFFSRIRDDIEKEDAFQGLCAMVNSRDPFTLPHFQFLWW